MDDSTSSSAPRVRYSNRLLVKVAIVLGCVVSMHNIFNASTPSKSNKLNQDDFQEGISRQMSIDYGDGTCKWQPPAYEVPEYISFHKTIIAGYPRCAKT